MRPLRVRRTPLFILLFVALGPAIGAAIVPLRAALAPSSPAGWDFDESSARAVVRDAGGFYDGVDRERVRAAMDRHGLYREALGPSLAAPMVRVYPDYELVGYFLAQHNAARKRAAVAAVLLWAVAFGAAARKVGRTWFDGVLFLIPIAGAFVAARILWRWTGLLTRPTEPRPKETVTA